MEQPPEEPKGGDASRQRVDPARSADGAPSEGAIPPAASAVGPGNAAVEDAVGPAATLVPAGDPEGTQPGTLPPDKPADAVDAAAKPVASEAAHKPHHHAHKPHETAHEPHEAGHKAHGAYKAHTAHAHAHEAHAPHKAGEPHQAAQKAQEAGGKAKAAGKAHGPGKARKAGHEAEGADGAAAHAHAHRRRRRRRLWFHVSGACAGLFVGVPVALLAVAFVIGPFRVDMLRSEVESVLQTLVGREGKAAIGSAEVSIGWQHGLVMYLNDVSMSGPVANASIRRITFDIDATAFLVGAGLKVHSIAIESPNVKFAVLQPATFRRPEPVALLELLNERLERVATLAYDRGLEQVTLVGGRLEVPRQQPEAPPLVLDSTAITVAAAAGGELRGRLVSMLDRQQWTASFSRTAQNGSTVVKVDAEDVGIASLLGLNFVSEDLTIAPKAEGRFDATGKATGFTASLNVGGGYIRLGEDGTFLQRADIAVAWRPAEGDIAITPSPILFGGSEVTLAGTVRAPDADNPRWTFDLTLPRARFAPSDIPGDPAVLQSAVVQGTVDPVTRSLVLSKIEATAGDQRAEASGAFDFGPNGPRGRFDGQLTNVAYSMFIRLWPSFIVTPGRKWVIENIIDGVIPTATMRLRMTPLDFDTDPTTVSPDATPAHLDMTFENASMKLPPKLPIATNGVGKLNMDNNILTANVATAATEAARGGPLAISDVTVVTSDLRTRHLNATISGTIAGAASGIATLADDEPINAMKPLGIDPAAVSGQAKVTFWLSGPMENVIDRTLIKWKIQAALQDVSSTAPIKDHAIKDATVDINADTTNLTLKGTANIDGLAAKVDLSQPIGPDAAPGHSGVTVELSEADRKARGLDYGGLLTGPVGATMVDNSDGTKSFTIDLKKASLTIPGIGWTKGPGVAALATFDMSEKDGIVTLSRLNLVADGVSIVGNVTLDGKNGLQRAEFSQFSLRPGDILKVKAERMSSNGYAITINGDNYDARGLIQQLKKGWQDKSSQAAGKVPLKIDAKVARIVGFGSASLNNVDLKASLTGDTVSKLDLTGVTGAGGAGVAVKIAPGDSGSMLTASAGDTGQVLRFLDLYKRLIGGKGQIRARMTDAGTAGATTVTAFSVDQDPGLQEMVATAAKKTEEKAAGQRVQAPPDAASRFESLDITFRVNGSVLQIIDAVLRGESSGGSANGTLNLTTQQLSLAGTFIPIFAINNLFGRIPIIGEILGGGRDGGLIGVTFKLEGPLANPTLSYNPISGVTPGILRRIFEYN